MKESFVSTIDITGQLLDTLIYIEFISYHSLLHLFSSKDKDNLLNCVCHAQSHFFPNSLFEPIIKG